MVSRSILIRCASTALCCVLLTAPMTVQAAPGDLFKTAGKTVVLVGKKSGSVLKETLKVFLKHPAGTVATGVGITLMTNPEVIAKPLDSLAQTPGDVTKELGKEGIRALNPQLGGFPLLPVLLTGLGAFGLYLRYRVRCKAVEHEAILRGPAGR
jgi:hypothetical protein